MDELKQTATGADAAGGGAASGGSANAGSGSADSGGGGGLLLGDGASDLDLDSLCAHFGLRAPSAADRPTLLGTLECVCAVERHSVSGGDGSPSKLYLLSSHLCVHQGAFGFTHRFAIPLVEVLSVIKAGGTGGGGGGAGPSGGALRGSRGGGGRGKAAAAPAASSSSAAAPASVQVQCRALSLTLTGISPELVEPLCRSIETARLASMDAVAIARDNRQAKEGIAGGAAAGASPGMMKRSRSSITWVAGHSSSNLLAGAAAAASSAAGKGKGKAGAEAAKAAGGVGGVGGVGRGWAAADGGGPRPRGDDAPRGRLDRRGDGGAALAARRRPAHRGAVGGAPSVLRASAVVQGADGACRGRGEPRALHVRERAAARREDGRGRSAAVVVGALGAGDMFGERTLVLGGRAGASVVADSEQAVVLRLSADRLSEISTHDPQLSAKLFCLLSCKQAARLQQLTAEEAAPVMVGAAGSGAPADMDAIYEHDACWVIFLKWARSLKVEAAAAAAEGGGGGPGSSGKKRKTAAADKGKADKGTAASSGGGDGPIVAMADLLAGCRSVRTEADADALHAAATALWAAHLSPDAPRKVDAVPATLCKAVEAALGGGGGKSKSKSKKGQASSSAAAPPAALRKAFEAPAAAVRAALGGACLRRFLASAHYS